jgi:Mg2+/citrate symporter
MVDNTEARVFGLLPLLSKVANRFVVESVVIGVGLYCLAGVVLYSAVVSAFVGGECAASKASRRNNRESIYRYFPCLYRLPREKQ